MIVSCRCDGREPLPPHGVFGTYCIPCLAAKGGKKKAEELARKAEEERLAALLEEERLERERLEREEEEKVRVYRAHARMLVSG